MLEMLVLPACFLGAGLLGFRLGTPGRVAGGLVVVGCSHLLAFLGSRQALASESGGIHLASQWLFLGGFAAIVWLASTYPQHPPHRLLVGTAVGLGLAGPLLAAVAGPTPAVVDGSRELGPVVRLVPSSLAGLAAAPLLVLPLLAVVVFAVRYRGATRADRTAMRWPVVGAACLLVAVVGGVLGAPDRLVTALFLLTAPVLPLALAFGPVARRMDALAHALARTQHELSQVRRPGRPDALARLTPREYDVLVAMAAGAANPVIARQLHLSLSSVEKHATSIFRKLEVGEGPEVHRRVAAVVAYRDALAESS